MSQIDAPFIFNTPLLNSAEADLDNPWAFIVLPKEVSEQLPRRGRTSIEGSINGHHFLTTLEPDGQLSHWFQVSSELQKAAGASSGDIVTLAIMPVAQEPEPLLPSDLQDALTADPNARKIWHDTTTIARVDWIHWITSAKQAKTRAKRISDACAMLAAGKKRVCCFDPSGFYSKAFCAPVAANRSKLP